MRPQCRCRTKVFLTKNAPKMINHTTRILSRGDSSLPDEGRGPLRAPFRSTWKEPLPDNEIHRQQLVKELLTPGLEVELRGLGRFIYSGIWDTMHAFYPVEGQDLPAIVAPERRRYVKRDLRGLNFIQLPYTLLADEVIIR